MEFTTAIRPHLKKTNTKISKQIKKLALCSKIPVLILGASSGIGKEIFDIYKNNKNINIISTYNKNRFVSNKKNIEIKNTLKFINYFEDIFEQCPYHPLEHTINVLKLHIHVRVSQP